MSKKEAQKHYFSSKRAKNTKLAIAAIAFMLLVLLYSKVSNLTAFLTSDDSGFSWNGGSVINLVTKSQNTGFISYDPNESTLKILEIPDSLYIDVRGRGQWQVRAIFDLGESDPDLKGPALLSKSVSNLLGLPVDGYIIFNDSLGSKSTREIIETFRSNPLILSALLTSKSNLSPVELTKLLFGIRGVRFDKIEDIDFEEKALSVATLPDGTSVFTTDQIKTDSISTKISDSQIESDRLSIAVYNATMTPGLATKAARMITNLGGNVIIIANSSKTLEKSIVLPGLSREEIKDSYTLKRLGQLFASDCFNKLNCDTILCRFNYKLDNMAETKTRCQVNDEMIVNSRADINVVLGEDFDL